MALTSDDQWRGAGVVFEAGHPAADAGDAGLLAIPEAVSVFVAETDTDMVAAGQPDLA
jgi:hypothetical protein